MSPFDLLDLLRKRPFEPFRIYTTEGRIYEIRHPDEALVLVSRVVVPAPRSDSVEGIPRHADDVALAHIVRIEEIPQETAPSVG
ncbi:MAG: hypothetical protein KY476_20955 [Planctomycetes bacterium]|nr:hypothetical protein [Planctomycetota bacterium]